MRSALKKLPCTTGFLLNFSSICPDVEMSIFWSLTSIFALLLCTIRLPLRWQSLQMLTNVVCVGSGTPSVSALFQNTPTVQLTSRQHGVFVRVWQLSTRCWEVQNVAL